MKAQVERVHKMSQTLESSGFSKQQSDAVIQSMGLAMQTFGVTPEMLDERIDKVMNAFKQRDDEIKDVRGEIRNLNTTMNNAFDKRDGEIKDVRGEITNLNTTMNSGFEKRDDEIKDVRGEIRNLNTNLNATMNNAFDKRDGEIKDVRGEIRNLNTTINSMQRTLNDHLHSSLVHMRVFTVIMVSATLAVLFGLFFNLP